MNVSDLLHLVMAKRGSVDNVNAYLGSMQGAPGILDFDRMFELDALDRELAKTEAAVAELRRQVAEERARHHDGDR